MLLHANSTATMNQPELSVVLLSTGQHWQHVTQRVKTHQQPGTQNTKKLQENKLSPQKVNTHTHTHTHAHTHTHIHRQETLRTIRLQVSRKIKEAQQEEKRWVEAAQSKQCFSATEQGMSVCFGALLPFAGEWASHLMWATHTGLRGLGFGGGSYRDAPVAERWDEASV